MFHYISLCHQQLDLPKLRQALRSYAAALSHLKQDVAAGHGEYPAWEAVWTKLNDDGLQYAAYNTQLVDVYWLIGGLEHFLFFHILGIVIPTD